MNVDGAGNRVAGMFWGHPLSIVVVGKNKIVPDLEAAFARIRNVIAPEHIKRRGGTAPCVKKECVKTVAAPKEFVPYLVS